MKNTVQCNYCKKDIIKDSENTVSYELSKGNAYACKSCRENYLQQLDTYKYIEDYIGVKLNKTTVQYLKKMNNQGASWEVILHAFKTKEQVIYNGFSKKGKWAWFIGVMKNTLPESYEILKQRDISRKKVEEAEQDTEPPIEINVRVKRRERLAQEMDIDITAL